MSSLGEWCVGGILVAGMLLTSLPAAAQEWQVAAPMPTARAYHAAATAGDRWYVAGGDFPVDAGVSEFPPEVDMYSPTTGQWSVVGQLAQPRDFLSAVTDPQGDHVLFVGGSPAVGDGIPSSPACDLAGRDGVTSAPSLLAATYLGAVAVAAGKFIVAGGWGGADPAVSTLMGDAETWDGMAASWTPAASLPGGPSAGHTMTTLQGGRRVLVVGGGTSNGSSREVDLFDALCGTWSRLTPLMVDRARHQAALLADGRVLVAGGSHYPGPNSVQTSVELFDPDTQTWKFAAPMIDARYDFDMVVLPDGRVLVAGGSNNAVYGEYGALRCAEVYDPVTDTWTQLPAMHDRRRRPTLAVLSDGVYVAGGDYSDSSPQFAPATVTVLASVERLSWSDLGIVGPVTIDAGSQPASATDTAAACDSMDGGQAPDGPGAGDQPADGGINGSQPDAVSPDVGASGGLSGPTNTGCSCASLGSDSDGLASFTLLMLTALLVRRRRS